VANVDFDHYFVQTGLLKVCFIILDTYAKLKNIKKHILLYQSKRGHEEVLVSYSTFKHDDNLEARMQVSDMIEER